MSKIDRLFAKDKDIEVGGVPLTIKPFTVKELPMLMKMNSTDTEAQAQAIQDVMGITLKKADPSITDEDIGNLSVEYLEELTEAILLVNNMQDKAKAMKEAQKV